MRKLAICLTVVAFVVAVSGISTLAQEKKAAEVTVTGYITDTHCKGEGAKENHKDCALKCYKEKGAQLAIWDSAAGKAWVLDDQKKAEEFAGESVTVKGVVDEATMTIKVASISKAMKDKKAS
jgi:Protein of unknown function (DUF5818)